MELFRTLYLFIYNGLSLLCWSILLGRAYYYFYVTLTHTLPSSSNTTSTFVANNLYTFLGNDLRWMQTLATFEILNALTGVVKSPILTTTMQIFSRLFIVWITLFTFGHEMVFNHWSFSTLVIAWAHADIIRYAFYGTSLIGWRPYFMLWLRYTAFLVLYPLGVMSECFLIILSIPKAKEAHPFVGLLMWAMVILYIPGLYTLYSHMLRQRSKVLNPSTLTSSKSKKEN